MSVEVRDNSPAVRAALDRAVSKSLETIGLQAEGYAKTLCPTDTGLLKNSITHALSGDSPAISRYYGSTHHGDTPVTQRNRVAGKPAPPPHEGHYDGIIGTREESAVYIGTNVEYAAYVEMGTSRTDPQPFLKPAVEGHSSEYRRMIDQCLREELG